MKLHISPSELEECYEDILVILGGATIEIDLDKYEVFVILRRAYQEFIKEVSIWQLQNQFSNVYGTPAGMSMFNQISTFNMNMVQQVTDWFSSMQRVGGKIPWHKDYITLEPGRQIYDLSKESSRPYISGTRRIHRIMWFGLPEILGGGKFNPTSSGLQGDDILRNSAWSFTNSGLNYSGSPLMFLGYAFDTILMMQSLETRKKVMFSDFHYSLSGDILELTPMPGSKALSISEGTKIFYYYFDEREVTVGHKLPQELLEAQNNQNGIIKKLTIQDIDNKGRDFKILTDGVLESTIRVVYNGVILSKDIHYSYLKDDNIISLISDFEDITDSDSFTIHGATENIVDNEEISDLFESEKSLIINPAQMKVEVVPWNMLSVWSKTWIWEWALARCKYIQGSKWRKVKKTFNASDAGFEIEFDYSSLIDEAKTELEALKTTLREDLQSLNLSKLMQEKQQIVDSAIGINKRSPRPRFLG